MEVILREHVDNLGRARRRRQGRAGYARNYLLPRKLALAVTEDNKRQIEREKKARRGQGRRREARSRRRATPQRLGALEIEIARRVGENDTLYGSVTSADIAQALEAKGFEVDKRKIQLPDPIKALGEIRCR